MKSGIKSLFENIVEEAISASSSISMLAQSIQVIAVESKKIAESVLLLSEKINQHETIIVEICNMLVEQSEKNDKKQSYAQLSLSTLKSNKDTKPN